LSETLGRGRVMLIAPELPERTYPGRPSIYYLGPHLRDAGFEVLYRDASFQHWRSDLQDFQPDVVGCGALSVQINEAIDVLKESKRLCPETVTVIGGNHATMAGQYLFPIHSGYLDAVVVGPGQRTIVAVADATVSGRWESGRGEIPGLMFWDGERVVETKPAEQIPADGYLPDLPYHPTYDFSVLGVGGKTPRTFQMMTCQGCLDACYFCENSAKRRCERRMSIPVAEAFIRRASVLGYEAVYFDDDTLTRDRDHVLALSRICRQNDMVFGGHTRPDCEDPGLIRQMADDGCRYMFSGLESRVPAILLAAHKTDEPAGYIEAYRLSFAVKKEVGISDSAFMIHGMPRLEASAAGREYNPDTLEDSKCSIEFAIWELDPNYLSMNVLRFLPGTPFSASPLFESMRPVVGPLHGGYFDRKWCEANGVENPCGTHLMLRAYEGRLSPVPVHMTPQRCYDILTFTIEEVNRKNRLPGRNQTRIVVDPWFEQHFMDVVVQVGRVVHQLAPFDVIDRASRKV